ncbi:Helicase C-terminal [Penicillium freii]|uniref:Uncharacterized protein n=1 Tax=Penicillium freii TaxID=48697 RepID=A0A101MR70_PENFR|nr:Helicase C-terminal [Penicillium freii]KUM65207.1 hypothetical protein ACN42_g1851 [Penicillium freii]
MWNKTLDFCGYFSLLWNTDFTQTAEIPLPDQETTTFDISDIGIFESWFTALKQSHFSSSQPLPYFLLAPSRLVSLARKGHLSTAAGFSALPIILYLTTLCRNTGNIMAGYNNKPIAIGGDIPHPRRHNRRDPLPSHRPAGA